MEDKRNYPRVPVHLQVRYPEGVSLISSWIDSLSLGGVFIRTSRPLPIGTELTLEILIQDDPEPVRIRAKVVWERLLSGSPRQGISGDGMGVAFLEAPPERLKKLLTSKGA